MYLYKIQLWAEYEFMNCTRNGVVKYYEGIGSPDQRLSLLSKLDIYNVV